MIILEALTAGESVFWTPGPRVDASGMHSISGLSKNGEIRAPLFWFRLPHNSNLGISANSHMKTAGALIMATAKASVPAEKAASQPAAELKPYWFLRCSRIWELFCSSGLSGQDYKLFWVWIKP